MNIYVDYLNGNDANPGTEAQPVKLISYALTVVGANDFVLLNDNADHVVTGALAFGSSRRFRPYGGGYATIDLSAGSLDISGSALFERISFAGGTTEVSGTGSVAFRNCIFIIAGILVSGAAPLVRIDNCIGDNVSAFFAITGTLNSESRIKNCIFTSVTSIATGVAITMTYSCRFSSALGTAVLGGGNIEADPDFGGPGNGDYRLLNSSPCIDTGDPSILDGSRPPAMGEDTSDMGGYGGPFNVEQNTAEELFVDSLSGLDIQLGTIYDPLQTIPEAVGRVPAGGKVTLRGSHTYILSAPIVGLDAYLSTYSEDQGKATVQGEYIQVNLDTADIDSIGFEDIIFLTDTASPTKKSIYFNAGTDVNVDTLILAKRCVFKGLLGSDVAGVGIDSGVNSISGTMQILNCVFDRSSPNLSTPSFSIDISSASSPEIEFINTVFSNMALAVTALGDYDPAKMTFSYSWFYGNVEDFDNSSSISGEPNYKDTSLTGSDNPLYVDELTADYRLQSIDTGYNQDSPLIDAGLALFFDEQDGDQRGTIRADIGAYGGALSSNPITVTDPQKSAETSSYKYRDIYDTITKSMSKLQVIPSYIPEGQELVKWVDDAVRYIGINYAMIKKTNIFTATQSRYIPISKDDIHGVEHVFVPFDELCSPTQLQAGWHLVYYNGLQRNEYMHYNQYLRKDLNGPVEAITIGTTTVIVATDHGLIDNDFVRFSDIIGVRASGEIHKMNGEAWPVTFIDNNSYSIPLDSSEFDKWESGGRWQQCTYVVDFKLDRIAGTRFEIVYETIPMQRVTEESIVDLPSGMWESVVDLVISKAYKLSGHPQLSSGYRGSAKSSANDHKIAEDKSNRNNVQPKPIGYPNPSRSGYYGR